jgi:ketosteroid isomerase-like protein
MSQENVDMVRRIYEDGLIDRDPERLLALTAADVEYVNPPEAVDPGIRRGRVEVMQAFRNTAAFFDSTRHEVNELFDAGATVVADVSFMTCSRGSETEVVQREAHTWTLAGGVVVRFEWGRDLAAALEAAGLRE